MAENRQYRGNGVLFRSSRLWRIATLGRKELLAPAHVQRIISWRAAGGFMQLSQRAGCPKNLASIANGAGQGGRATTPAAPWFRRTLAPQLPPWQHGWRGTLLGLKKGSMLKASRDKGDI